MRMNIKLSSADLTSSREDEIAALVKKYRPDLKPYETIYKELHADPELSRLETKTAARAAAHLKKLGFPIVHENIGGGVVGVLHNDYDDDSNGNSSYNAKKGPVVLLRADMDALPVKEETGLPYASMKTMTDYHGKENQPVMHACGHDTHITSLMAASELLIQSKAKWKGTLIALFQPSEEEMSGAKRMIKDGLYDKVPLPDVVLGQHVGSFRAGSVLIRAGPIMTASDTFDIRIWGRGSHASMPQMSIDPILLTAYILVRLQSVPSREVNPQDFVVITCGQISGGTAPNIIPDFCDLTINVRSYTDAVRKQVIEAVKRIIKEECKVSRCPKDPEIKHRGGTQSTINDEKVVAKLKGTFEAQFGEALGEMERSPASEDFGVLGSSRNIPYAFWSFGCVEASEWDKAVKEGKVDELPKNHSPRFAPAIEPTLQTAVDAMAGAALTYLYSSK